MGFILWKDSHFVLGKAEVDREASSSWRITLLKWFSSSVFDLFDHVEVSFNSNTIFLVDLLEVWHVVSSQLFDCYFGEYYLKQFKILALILGDETKRAEWP